MKSKAQKQQIRLIETEKEVRRAMYADIKQEVKERIHQLEQGIIDLQDALRGLN